MNCHESRRIVLSVPQLSETAPLSPVIDSLRSSCGLPLAGFLRSASVPVLLPKNRLWIKTKTNLLESAPNFGRPIS